MPPTKWESRSFEEVREISEQIRDAADLVDSVVMGMIDHDMHDTDIAYSSTYETLLKNLDNFALLMVKGYNRRRRRERLPTNAGSVPANTGTDAEIQEHSTKSKSRAKPVK